jgi:Fic family protein
LKRAPKSDIYGYMSKFTFFDSSLFKYPYTKIEFLERDLGISRSTAIRYLEELVKNELLEKQKMGRESYYVNKPL